MATHSAGSRSTKVLLIDTEKVNFDALSDRIETELIRTSFGQMCLKMQVNDPHVIYDKHHNVSFFLKSHQIKVYTIQRNMKMTLCDVYS